MPVSPPLGPRHFLLLAQEKVPKEKGTPRHSSALLDKAASQPYLTEPIPCVPRQSGGRAQLGDLRGISPVNHLKQVRGYSPDWLRYSVSTTGGKSTPAVDRVEQCSNIRTQTFTGGVDLPPVDTIEQCCKNRIQRFTGGGRPTPPVGAAEHRSENRMKHALV